MAAFQKLVHQDIDRTVLSHSRPAPPKSLASGVALVMCLLDLVQFDMCSMLFGPLPTAPA